MDYQQSRAYVKDADQYAGGALDLTNIKELMNRLGNPQDRLKYVHVPPVCPPPSPSATA